MFWSLNAESFVRGSICLCAGSIYVFDKSSKADVDTWIRDGGRKGEDLDVKTAWPSKDGSGNER